MKFHFSPQPTLRACERFFIPLITQFIFLVVSVTAVGQNITWEKPYAGNDPSLLYYPDQNAVYFRYGWENNKEQGVVIKGKMPEARYFSFDLYNDYTKSSIAALADYEIIPDEGDPSGSATMQEKEPIISKVMTMPIFKHYTDPKAIGAFNYNSSGNYPNKDNHYIVMPVFRKKENVLVVRFKVPTHATTLGDTSKNARYYSLSQGNEYTNTSITMHDEQLKVSNDGFVYVVVAKDTEEARTKANEMGLNFMPWLYKERIVLILRHMLPLPGFKQSTREVPVFDNRKPALGQEAQQTIGEYALVGKFISKSSWKSYSRIEQAGF